MTVDAGAPTIRGHELEKLDNGEIRRRYESGR
jgi:hypothetical protein